MGESMKRIDAVCRRLLKDPEAIPWHERETLARKIGESLQRLEDEKHSGLVPVLEVLAADGKWDVRRAVANALPHLRSEDFERLAGMLSGDENRFVRQAMLSGLSARERNARDRNRKRSAIDRAMERIESLRRRHGDRVANEVFRVGELYYDALAGPVAHDMNGVIDPLDASLATIRESLAALGVDDIDVSESIALMTDRLGFLQRLIGDMRQYALASPETVRNTRLAPLIAEARSMARDRLKAKGIAIGRDGRDDVPKGIVVEISRDHILRAVKNVIRNAYESYPADAKNRPVHVRAWYETKDMVAVEVRDEGGGIGAKHLAKVKTFTFGNSTKKNEGGTGFGLPTARRFIRAHGGEISIDSEPGKGTVVRMTIPVRQQEGEDE